MDDIFKGPSAVAFSNDDVVAPAKILADFAKKVEALEIKAGVVEGKVSSKEEIEALAKNYQAAKGYFQCYYQYYKHQFATLHWQSKPLQIKKRWRSSLIKLAS